jgi:uncharacterized protein (UPF0333 family)
MKIETLSLHVIILILGLALIFVARESIQDTIKTKAYTEKAKCLIESASKNIDIHADCENIGTYKLRDFIR